jgi:hypothetical protein
VKQTVRDASGAVAHVDGDRDLRLDACRGLALWFIFIDHIPGNAFEWLTLRSYGFSDASEIFVFVSGYTCMLAYGGALRSQGWGTVIIRSLRRSMEIYAAFLLLVIIYLALIWLSGSYLDDTNTRFFFETPGTTLVHLLALQYAPVNTDILPLRHTASRFSARIVGHRSQRRHRPRRVVFALYDGADIQLAFAGLAEW